MWSKQSQKSTSLTTSLFNALRYSKVPSKNQTKPSSSKQKPFSLPKRKNRSLTASFKQHPINNKSLHSPRENNTIDINISVNYHKNANLLKHSKQHKNSNTLYKTPTRKTTSYSMNQSAHKRNASACSDSNIIHNNLNISFTNISSPKANNSFIVNPIFYNGGNHSHHHLNKSVNMKHGVHCNSSVINISNSDGRECNRMRSKMSKRNKTKIEHLKKVMNDKMKECELKEGDVDEKYDSKFSILQSCLEQFMNYVQSIKEAEFLISFNKHLKEIVCYKNKKINELLHVNGCLVKKVHMINKNSCNCGNSNSNMNDGDEFEIENDNEDNDVSNGDNDNDGEVESSVRDTDLESIRFFDKIQMRTNSVSHTKVPKLNLNFNNNNMNNTNSNKHVINNNNINIHNNNNNIGIIYNKNNSNNSYYVYKNKNLKSHHHKDKYNENGRNTNNINVHINNQNIHSSHKTQYYQGYSYSTKAEFKQKNKNHLTKKTK